MVVKSIAWKSLSIALRQIHQACLCIKICNDLLPTARILYPWKQQGHDSCSLFGKEETTKHVILCDHASHLKLSRHYINSLQARLKMVNTNTELINTFCSAITDWFDYGAVDPSKYPEQYYQATQQQTNIGWRHVYMGHLAIAWAAIQIPGNQSTNIAKAQYM